MPTQDSSREQKSELHQFQMVVDVFGPIRPSQDLHRQTHRALKGHSSGRDFFTDITLHESHNGSSMRVEYTVSANSPTGAERAGAVYLGQLCDLLSVVTRSPVWFYMPDEDTSDERNRMRRRATTVDRVLSEPEWLWITGNLVFLRRTHAPFLAAASWYRKGLIGRDSLDDFCCFWRVIERLANHYADRSAWSDDEKAKSEVKKCVGQLTSDLFDMTAIPSLLRDDKALAEIRRLRNNLSHGNIPITPEVIDQATEYLKPLEHAAFEVLQAVRDRDLVCDVPT